MKECTKCLRIKDFSEFYKESRPGGRLRARCKSCTRSEDKVYKKNNKDYYKEYYKEYNQRENVKKKAKISRGNRLKKRMKTQIKYTKNKYTKDPVYKKRVILSTRLRSALTGKEKYTKRSSLTDIVGLDWRSLINYLHSTFEENYGLPREYIDLKEVEIDHVVPIKTAKTVSEVESLNHYTNLQLLFKEDNMNKRDNIIIKEKLK